MPSTAQNSPERITVLVHYNRISLFYTLAPFLRTPDVANRLDFTQSIDDCLNRDRNRNLLIVRYFEGQGLHDDRVDLRLMKRLRDKYERITFFDDSDGAGCTRFEVMPFIDLYLKKQLFRDRDTYRQRLYGRQLFTDYYHRVHSVEDTHPHFREPLQTASDANKLRLAWNLGVGSFPIHARLLRLGVAAARMVSPRIGFLPYRNPNRLSSRNRNQYDVHARFGSPVDRPTVAFQRRLLLERMQHDRHFLTGRVKSKQYNDEIRHAKITLSPFGWGEVCFRDFEAIRNGSLLLKPRMDHLETWPDVFRPHATYVPITWDGSDLIEKAHDLLNDAPKRARITDNATDVYRTALQELNARARKVASWITDRSS